MVLWLWIRIWLTDTALKKALTLGTTSPTSPFPQCQSHSRSRFSRISHQAQVWLQVMVPLTSDKQTTVQASTALFGWDTQPLFHGDPRESLRIPRRIPSWSLHTGPGIFLKQGFQKRLRETDRQTDPPSSLSVWDGASCTLTASIPPNHNRVCRPPPQPIVFWF